MSKIMVVLLASGVLAVGACDTGSYQFAARSMEPTIKKGDTFFVDFSAYRGEPPKRWDLVAYEQETQFGPSLWIGRLVGLPREEVQIDNRGILVDGRRLKIPRELSHLSYIPREALASRIPPSTFRVYSVPEDSYFMLGDNSRRAKDSRFLGAVASGRLKGKVKLICEYDLQCVWYDLLCTWGPQRVRPNGCNGTVRIKGG